MVFVKSPGTKFICPAVLSGLLDNAFRKLFQNPKNIMQPFIHNGMTILDLGCGPGFFSIEIAKLLQGSGSVIAADIQRRMLDKIVKKIKGTDIEKLIKLHECGKDGIGLTENVDFVLAFYMIHEVPDQDRLFSELKLILKPGGQILVIEPRLHVPKKLFANMVLKIEAHGFHVKTGPKVFFSRSLVLSHYVL